MSDSETVNNIYLSLNIVNTNYGELDNETYRL